MGFGNFLKASWEYLAMVNYRVNPDILLPYLPPYTELDLFEGQCLVSLVGFQFNNTKVFGIGWPGYKNFEEVNLRFYVKRFNGKEWERGVAFVSEVVPKKFIAFLANTCYNERYSTARMRHELRRIDDKLYLAYSWKKNGHLWNRIQLVANPHPKEIEAGSAEEFIFDHFTGFNRLNHRTTIRYEIQHPRWTIFPVHQSHVQCDVSSLYGAEFVPFLKNPEFACLAKGSPVTVHLPRRIGK